MNSRRRLRLPETEAAKKKSIRIDLKRLDVQHGRGKVLRPSSRSEVLMRIAITAAGNDLDAELDLRFARACYIMIFSSEGTLLETIDNRRNIYAVKPPRDELCSLLADKKVDILVKGASVSGARNALECAGIRVVEEPSKTVREALERFTRTQADSRKPSFA